MKTKLITLLLFVSTFLGAQIHPQVNQDLRATVFLQSSTDNGAGNYDISFNSYQDPTGVLMLLTFNFG